MKNRTLIAVCLLGLGIVALARSQPPLLPAPQVPSTIDNTFDPDSDIPRGALLTEKGKQLAARLKMLREAESRMGSKHPSLPTIQQQIAQVRIELKNWIAQPAKKGGQPMANIRQLTNEELQQVVLRLAEEVDVLKQKVARMETQLEIH